MRFVGLVDYYGSGQLFSTLRLTPSGDIMIVLASRVLTVPAGVFSKRDDFNKTGLAKISRIPVFVGRRAWTKRAKALLVVLESDVLQQRVREQRARKERKEEEFLSRVRGEVNGTL